MRAGSDEKKQFAGSSSPSRHAIRSHSWSRASRSLSSSRAATTRSAATRALRSCLVPSRQVHRRNPPPRSSSYARERWRPRRGSTTNTLRGERLAWPLVTASSDRVARSSFVGQRRQRSAVPTSCRSTKRAAGTVRGTREHDAFRKLVLDRTAQHIERELRLRLELERLGDARLAP